MSGNTITFALSKAQLRRFSRAAAVPAQRQIYVGLCIGLAINTLSFIRSSLRWHDDSRILSFLIVAGFLIGIAYLVFAGAPYVKPARSVNVRLTPDGFIGTIDGAPADVRWHDIESVTDTGEVLILRRRRGRRPLAIPLSAIGNLQPVWTELEDHLVAKRGLIRTSQRRTYIVNSAC